jgi:ParB family chromosome partitioning protein
MRKIADSIPHDIIRAIGRAKNVGRPAWLDLAKHFENPGAEKRVRKLLETEDFQVASAHERVSMAARAAKGRDKKAATETSVVELASNGTVFAKMKSSASSTMISIPRSEMDFSNWLGENLATLYQNFQQQRNDGESSEN